MTKEQFDKKYAGEGLVVHCDTKEKAIEFLNLAHSFGYSWCDGESYVKWTYWGEYNDQMCYCISRGSYSPLHHYKSIGFTIVKFGKQNFTKDDLEDGYRVVLRNGEPKFVLKRANSLNDVGGYKHNTLANYDETLIFQGIPHFDIMQVYDREDNLVWEREEKTEKQIKIEELQRKAQEIADELKKLEG